MIADNPIVISTHMPSPPTPRLVFSSSRLHTGTASHGQEWSKDLRQVKRTSRRDRTLSPVWNESMQFKVPRADALLRVVGLLVMAGVVVGALICVNCWVSVAVWMYWYK